MNEISPLGWVIIIFFGLILLATNLSLISALRKPQKKNDSSMVNKLIKTARDPFGQENRDWEKLSAQVKEFKKSETDASQPPDKQPPA